MEICRIICESAPQFFPDCQVVTIPVADGGEGTVECFLEALGAEPVTIPTTGPYGEPIRATYARKEYKAVVEMSSAAGLPMVGEQRNPSAATTYGVGTIIRHAIESGCTEIMLGLGGSATNDGGCGCAAALGVKFYDQKGDSFVPVGGTLSRICRIDVSQARNLLKKVHITAMCDVDNPLYGPSGAACVFAPQKGADEIMVKQLDSQLRCLDQAIKRELGISVANVPGSGAAGGMAAGCMAFLNAELKPGIEAILNLVEFDRHLDGTDLVITGEGRIDAQSTHGKVISGVAKRTKSRNIPLVAVVGSITDDVEKAYQLGITAMFGINREAVSFEQCAHKAHENYRRTVADIFRLVQAIEEQTRKYK